MQMVRITLCALADHARGFRLPLVLCGMLLLNVATVVSVRAAEPESQAAWPEPVARLLAEQCGKCHGDKQQSQGLQLTSVGGVLSGSETGPVLAPGAPEASRLWQVVQPEGEPHMPPGGKQLSDEQIEVLRSWIASLPADLELPQHPSAADEQLAGDTADVAGPAGAPWLPPSGVDPTTVIDLLIQAQWQSQELQPSARCDDATFVRRIYLDLIGRIPTREEQQAFLQATRSDKRRQLVETLLASQEHARHLADVFDVVLLGRAQGRKWEARLKHGWRDYLEEAFYTNRPWDQMAREMILARVGETTDVRAGWFLYERDNDHQQIAEAIAPAFFGIRIECAQCHDHPLAAEIEQRHYWGLVAFFNRSENQTTPVGPRVVEKAVGGFSRFTDLAGNSHPSELTFLQSATIPEAQPPEGEEVEDTDENYTIPVSFRDEPPVPKFSRRQQFADKVLSDHPLVARAMVNRLWALLVGRGFVHPVDRMDSEHAVSHPLLLEWLARDFRQHGYDVRRLIRSIVLSRCYQLAAPPADSTSQPEHFAHALEKPLLAESLWRSLQVVATGAPPAAEGPLLDEFRRLFPDVFPETPTADASQSLFLTNQAAFHELLDGGANGTVAQLLAEPDVHRQVDALFQLALGRDSAADERDAAVTFLQQPERPRRQGLTHLMWALVTGAEFRFNH